MATGADDIYITRDPELVEREHLLPLLKSGDLAGGSIQWSGGYLVNPWTEAGLVDLTRAPRPAAYLRRHDSVIKDRHVAQRRPVAWYRTIDRVTPGLQHCPKLLLPDIKAASHPVLDVGHFYPHHNLYVVTSDEWDLEVLGGLLLSDLTNLFVGAYCVKMRGGCYRFQAQYLRKVCVPRPGAIDAATNGALRRAFRTRDREAATKAATAAVDIDLAVLRRAI